MLVTKMHAYLVLKPVLYNFGQFFHMSGLYLDFDGGYGTTFKPGKRVFSMSTDIGSLLVPMSILFAVDLP